MLNGTELAVTGFRAEENDRKNGDNHRCTEDQENGADSKLILNQVTGQQRAEDPAYPSDCSGGTGTGGADTVRILLRRVGVERAPAPRLKNESSMPEITSAVAVSAQLNP